MRIRVLLAAAMASISILQSGQVPAIAADATPVVPAVHRAWVVVAGTPRIPAEMTDAEVNGVVDSALQFWVRETDGLVSSFTRVTTEPMHIEANVGMCPALNNSEDAVALWNDAADAVGFPGGPNDHLIVLIPKECQSYVPGDFGASTLGTTPNSGGKTLSILGSRAAEALTVELGHNLSLGEARTAWCWTCLGTASDMYSPVGDLTQLKGTPQPPVLGTAQRDLLGLVPHDSPTSLVSQLTYSLRARGATSLTGATGLRVTWGDEVYTIEYRAGLDEDANTAYATVGGSLTGQYRFPTGVTVTKVDATDRTSAVLSTFRDNRDGAAAIDTGTSWRIDPEVNRFTVTVNSRDAQTAQVTLTPGTSANVAMVTADRRHAPAIALSGSRSVGRTVAVKLVDWPVVSAPTYLWRIGSTIIGQSASLRLPAAAAGKIVELRVGGTAGFLPVSMRSTFTVAPGTLMTSKPVITGTARVGKTLRASPGRWTDGTSLRYRWYANAKAISGATRSSYVIGKALKGKKIRVRVTGAKLGYVSVSRFSAYTKTVAPR